MFPCIFTENFQTRLQIGLAILTLTNSFHPSLFAVFFFFFFTVSIGPVHLSFSWCRFFWSSFTLFADFYQVNLQINLTQRICLYLCICIHTFRIRFARNLFVHCNGIPRFSEMSLIFSPFFLAFLQGNPSADWVNCGFHKFFSSFSFCSICFFFSFNQPIFWLCLSPCKFSLVFVFLYIACSYFIVATHLSSKTQED